MKIHETYPESSSKELIAGQELKTPLPLHNLGFGDIIAKEVVDGNYENKYYATVKYWYDPGVRIRGKDIEHFTRTAAKSDSSWDGSWLRLNVSE